MLKHHIHSVIILFWNLFKVLNDWNIFYCLYIILFFENSSNKVSSLLFIFVCQITGHSHFANNDIRFSCEPDRPTLGFFNFMMSEKSTKNLQTQNLWFATPGFSTWKRNPPLSQSLIEQELINICLAFILCYTGCIYHSKNLLMWVSTHKA